MAAAVGVTILTTALAAPTPGVEDEFSFGAQASASHVQVAGKVKRGPASHVATPTRANGSTPVVSARRLEPIPCYQPGAVVCGRDAQVCEASADGAPRTLYWIFTGPLGVANPTADQWNLTGSQCLTPAEAAAAAPGAAVPVLTAAQFRRLPLPAGVVHIQPGNGRTLVNIPTNVYVTARTTVLPTTVLGQPVRVRATPIGYDWTFGDGRRLHTGDPGAPYPDLRTTHTYTAPGTLTLGLTTTYRGEYSVDNGPWLPVDGTATVISPAQNLVVVAARSELVADPLPT